MVLLKLTLFFVFLCFISAFGQTTEPKDTLDIFSIPLRELSNIHVYSASKKNEKLIDAPGVITVYDKNDINDYGYYTLSDLSNITAGYSSYSIYGEKVFETRGQKAGSFNNNKHLLVIDGIPVNFARSNKVNTEEELPLFFANKVEFLRGPASSLYGIGAFYGVVNITTPDSELKGTSADNKISFGSLDLSKRIMSNVNIANEHGNLKLNFGYFQKDASKEFVGLVNNSNNLYWDDQKSTFFNVSYQFNKKLKGLSFGTIYMNKSGGLGEHWMHGNYTSEVNNIQWTTLVIYSKYEKQFSKKLKLNSYLKLNESIEKGWWSPFDSLSYLNYNGTGSNFEAYSVPVRNIEGQVEMHWINNKIADITAGVNIDSRQQLGQNNGAYIISFSADSGDVHIELPVNKSILFNTFSTFLQVKKEIPFMKGLLLTAGVRNDYGQAGTNSYNQVSPRVGLVQKLNKNISLKLLYSTALRAPGLKEVQLNNETLSREPDLRLKDLKAEKINSFETALIIQKRNILSSITVFHNTTSNTLDGTRVLDNNIFINSDSIYNAAGIELEFKYATKYGVKGFANYAFALVTENKWSLNAIPIQSDVPSQKVNLGILYDWNTQNKLTTALVTRWVKGFRVANNLLPNPEGFFLIDFNSKYQITTKLGCEFQVRNILNNQFKLPKDGIIDIPMPDRTFNFSLNFNL